MRVSVPQAVTDSIITASNLLEDDHPEWDVLTAYTTGDRVIVIATHRIYEAVQPTTGDDPTTDTTNTYWVDVGATNRFKPFDQRLADQAINESGSQITYTLSDFGVPITSISLFNLEGTTAFLTVTDATDGVVYDEEISLIDTSYIIDGFTYCFEPNRVRSEAVFSEIPPYASADFDVVVENTSGDPQVGQIVAGQEFDLGLTVYGTRVSIEDFSVKERDQFGNALLVARPFAKLVDFRFIVDTETVRRSAIILEGLRATPVVYFTDVNQDQYGATVYGFYRNWRITLSGPALSEGVLEVEGLT